MNSTEDLPKHGVMDSEELWKHESQHEVWCSKLQAAQGLPIEDADRAIIRLVRSYGHAIAALLYARERFPGRLTAASNAVRSLHAAIRGMWFELEGDEFSVKL